MTRSLNYRDRNNESSQTWIPWVVTNGPGMEEARNQAERVNDFIANSDLWNQEPVKPTLKVVSRNGPNLRRLFFKRRALALHRKSDLTVPCRARNCQTCILVSNNNKVINNNREVHAEGGCCKSSNIIYAAKCQLCVNNNVYVRRTFQKLSQRINGHRFQFYNILKGREAQGASSLEIDDGNILGAHLVLHHDLKLRTDFNNSFKFTILKLCPPRDIRREEQHFIEKLKTLQPFGLNQVNSIG